MTLTRRAVLGTALMMGGGLLATLAAPRRLFAGAPETIGMRSAGHGAHVWFAPIGLAIAPGTLVRFVNDSPGNVHTSTAYHPSIGGRPLRIPQDAEPWDSGFVMPKQSFEVTLTVPGVYDYYCKPHEMAGMVGRIVVGAPDTPGWSQASPETGGIPDVALANLPPVEALLRAGRVEPEEAS